MNNLLTKISENTGKTRMEVLDKINTENYEDDKKSFLSIWNEALLIGIKEIIHDGICPNVISIF